jgi:hypothetical protein
MRSSARAPRANGFTCPVGWLPAENALKRTRPASFISPSAMMERAEFPVHTKSTL